MTRRKRLFVFIGVIGDQHCAKSLETVEVHDMETALFTKIMLGQSDEKDPVSALADLWLDPTQGLKAVALYAHRIPRAHERNTAELKKIAGRKKGRLLQG